MKKKNTVQINSIFNDLILRYKISLLLIFLICISISYIYNNIYKSTKYNYSIELEVGQISDVSSNLNNSVNDEFNLQIYKKELFEYLRNLPKNVEKKTIIYEDFSFFVAFESKGRNVINIDNFLETVNVGIRNAKLSDISRMYEMALWNKEQGRYFEYQKVLDSFDTNYPQIDLMLSLDEFIQIIVDEMSLQSSNEAKLQRLKYTIDNFDKLFTKENIYSLNGWQITDNIFNNTENFFAGILFGSLISSFFLFLKSNYFRKKLSN